MELPRVDLDSRPLVHCTPVHVRATRQSAKTGLSASLRQEGLDHVAEAREGGPDGGIDDGSDPFAVGCLRDRRSGDKNRAGGGFFEQAIKLVGHSLRDDPAGQQPEPAGLVDLIDMRVDIARVCGQAGEPPVEPLGRVRPLRLGKHHEKHLRAVIHVIDRQQPPPFARDRLELDEAEESEHIPGHGILGVAVNPGDGTSAKLVKLGERRARKLGSGGTSSGGRILNTLVVPLVTDCRGEEGSQGKKFFPVSGGDLLCRK